MSEALSPRVRLLLWNFDRGDLAYEVLGLLALLVLFLVPPAFWGDPLYLP